MRRQRTLSCQGVSKVPCVFLPKAPAKPVGVGPVTHSEKAHGKRRPGPSSPAPDGEGIDPDICPGDYPGGWRDWMDHVFLTYEEAATRLRIKPDSVRRRARARKWPRQVGNDGLTRVGVPSGLLEPDKTPGTPPGAPPGPPPDTEAAELRVENRFLREQVKELREERDRWRTQAERLSEPRPSFFEGVIDRLFRRDG